MKHEILIDANRSAVEPAFRNQCTAFIAADRNGLFDQSWYAGLKKWQCGFGVEIGRRQYVYAIHLASRERLGGGCGDMLYVISSSKCLSLSRDSNQLRHGGAHLTVYGVSPHEPVKCTRHQQATLAA